MQYLGLISDDESARSLTPMQVALRHSDLLASIAYLAMAIRIFNTIDRAYRQSHALSCTSVAAFDAVIAAVPLVCVIAIVAAIARGLYARESANQTQI